MRRPPSARCVERRSIARRSGALAVLTAAVALIASCGPPTRPKVESGPPKRAPAFVAQAGHFAGVRDLSFSPDSEVIASTGGVDRAVNIWDADDGGLLAVLREEGSVEWTVAFGPDDDRIASGGADGAVRIWDPSAPETSITTWNAHERDISDLAWHPDGERLVTVSPDGKVALWIAETGEAQLAIEDRPATSVAVAPDGERIAVGGNDGRLALLDVADGSLKAELRWLESPINGLAWSPDEQRIAAARLDGSVQIWDAETGELALGLEGHRGPVHGVCYSPDGEAVATAGNDGTVRIWEAETGAAIAAFEGDWSSVLSVAWSPDGGVIASGGMGGAVRLWDSETYEPLAELTGRPTDLTDATWSPDGNLIAAGADDGTVRIWDVSTGGIRQVLKAGRLPFADGSRILPEETEIEEAPDPGSEEGRVAMLGAFMRSLLKPLAAQVTRVDVVAFSPDGELIAAAIRGGVMRIWDVETGRQRGASYEHSDEVFDIAWAPDGRHLAVGLRDGRLLVWHIDSEQAQWLISAHDGAINDLAWSPDGGRIATAGADGNVRLWEPAGTAPLVTLHGCAGRAGSVAWNPEGTRLAVGNPVGTLTIVDPANGERLSEIEVEHSMILRLAWSPKGEILAAAAIRFEKGFIGEILLFDAKNGRALDPLPGQSYYTAGVSFDPQGEHLVSVGGAGLRMHRLSDRAWLTLDAFPLEDGRMGGVAYLDSGLFEGDEEAFEHLHFRAGRKGRGLRLLSGVDLRDTFHRPGLVADFLLGEPLPEEGEEGADE
jgi:WD40 repeat protein